MKRWRWKSWKLRFCFAIDMRKLRNNTKQRVSEEQHKLWMFSRDSSSRELNLWNTELLTFLSSNLSASFHRSATQHSACCWSLISYHLHHCLHGKLYHLQFSPATSSHARDVLTHGQPTSFFERKRERQDKTKLALWTQLIN